MFIGSEGSLGVVTAASILVPRRSKVNKSFCNLHRFHYTLYIFLLDFFFFPSSRPLSTSARRKEQIGGSEDKFVFSVVKIKENAKSFSQP